MRKLIVVGLLIAGSGFSQSLSDAEINAAIQHGRSTNGKKLWQEIKKNREVLINRAGFGDTIEKKVLFLGDADRIALEAAEAKRQLRDLSVSDVKTNMPLGITEVLLEANCYNRTYAGNLAKWSTEGNVHMVLKIDGQNVQPQEKREGGADGVSIGGQEHGIVTRQDNQTTYTPLYHSAIYERMGCKSWFIFPQVQGSARTVVAVIISGDGHTKEKDINLTF